VIPGVTVPASTSPDKNCSSSPTKTNDCGKSSSGGNRTSSMDVPTKLQTVAESTREEDDQFNIDM